MTTPNTQNDNPDYERAMEIVDGDIADLILSLGNTENPRVAFIRLKLEESEIIKSVLESLHSRISMLEGENERLTQLLRYANNAYNGLREGVNVKSKEPSYDK